ncbi:unnamed protein product [Brassicogethes aeneus]|uniref:Lateral signaling target protein 2 homolog n=1 Tax=Brassicogethes aeneus TaxID=1431903 RepID=A0A9P0B4C8_BRAAE|nr:unnamed protein product [Brassicogethes aeneus]
MDSIRKWFYKPKKDDKSLLAQFFYADEELNIVANELDSFDGRKDPERCTTLVNQLRQSQDKVLTITNAIMDVLIRDERANRDFRVKFPEDVLQENLAGQLWFGAECLAAGSSIMNRETESMAMRPLAKAVTKSLETVRNLLRNSCLRNNTPNGPLKLDSNELVTEMLLESLKIFDRLFSEFELAYVSAMVPVKSTQEYELQELIGVLFSETLQRALKMKLLNQDMVDDCDPALMFTIPRLAIVSGLLIFPNGPLCIDKSLEDMSEMFRPFRTLLQKIRELLWALNKRELYMLEKLLCDNEQIGDVKAVFSDIDVHSELDDFIDHFYPMCSDFKFLQISGKFNNTNEVSAVKKPVKHSRRKEESSSVNIPSTSGYLISNTIAHNAMVATNLSNTNASSLTPPEHDSLEIISEAAATLSSILSTNEHLKSKSRKPDLDSPNDSGICTETTSLDRSPSLDCCATNSANESCNCCAKKSYAAARLHPKSTLPARKQKCGYRKGQDAIEEDSSSASSDTSSFHSVCNDDTEIALALQAAEIACNNEIRSKYKSTEDLIHRLFVCIAGVADQLQTNFACDLRNILKYVFLINASEESTIEPAMAISMTKSIEGSCSLDTSIEYHPSEDEVIENNEFSVDPNILAQEALFDTNVYFHLDHDDCLESDYLNHPRQNGGQEERSLSSLSLNRYASLREDVANLHPDSVNNDNAAHADGQESNVTPPIWIPDTEAPKCMSCGANFTVVKRRHHCRSCGKVFCARCSSNSIPLPKFGHVKPVRVCNNCYIFNLII